MPAPPVEVAVTVNAVVPAGVAVVVEIVSVEVAEVFDTVVGLKDAVAPVGAVQLIVSGTEVQVPGPVHVVVIEKVAELPATTGFGVCVPTVVAVMTSLATTNVALELVIELVPQLPVPPVDAAVTVKLVEPAGVEPVVEMVSVDVALLFETVVGLKAAVAPAGAVQLIVKGTDVQVPAPVQLVVIV